MVISFSNIKKSILTNLEILATAFFLMSFSNIKKSTFWLSPFQILKNVNLWNSKHLTQFFLYPFRNIEKRILINFKKPVTGLFLIPFSNIKKAYLRILKYLAQSFCLLLSLIIKKKHHYESRNTWSRFFAYCQL